MTPEAIAQAFHETYERLAPTYNKVRAFIEEEAWQGFKVTSIDGYLETQYRPILQSGDEISPDRADYITSEVKVRFAVSAVHPADKRRLSCHVDVTSDGRLCLSGTQFGI